MSSNGGFDGKMCVDVDVNVCSVSLVSAIWFLIKFDDARNEHVSIQFLFQKILLLNTIGSPVLTDALWLVSVRNVMAARVSQKHDVTGRPAVIQIMCEYYLYSFTRPNLFLRN